MPFEGKSKANQTFQKVGPFSALSGKFLPKFGRRFVRPLTFLVGPFRVMRPRNRPVGNTGAQLRRICGSYPSSVIIAAYISSKTMQSSLFWEVGIHIIYLLQKSSYKKVISTKVETFLLLFQRIRNQRLRFFYTHIAFLFILY